jgi:hypothetical protein
MNLGLNAEALLASLALGAPVPKNNSAFTAAKLDPDQSLPDLGNNANHINPRMYEELARRKRTEKETWLVIRDKNDAITGVVVHDDRGAEVFMGNGTGLSVGDKKLSFTSVKNLAPIETGRVIVVGPTEGAHTTIQAQDKTGKDIMDISVREGNAILRLGENTQGLNFSAGSTLRRSELPGEFPTDIQIHAPSSMLAGAAPDNFTAIENSENTGKLKLFAGEMRFNIGSNSLALRPSRTSIEEPSVFINGGFNSAFHVVTERGNGTIPLHTNGQPQETEDSVKKAFKGLKAPAPAPQPGMSR